MKGKIVVAISFLIVFLLSFRFFFRIEGIVGHNWDWIFPADDIFLNRLNIWSLFIWRDFNLGVVINLTISHLIPTSLFSIVGPVLGIKLFLLFLFWGIITIAFTSFKRLLDFLIKKSFLNYIPSFLYAFSPFLFNDIIGGAWAMWVSYALCPIYFIFVVNYFQNDGAKLKYLLLVLLISLGVVISLQNFVLINILIIMYLFYEIIVTKNIEGKGIVKNVGILSLLLILINFYWIFPFFYSFGNFTQGIILNDGGIYEFDSIKNSAQTIWNIFNLGGYVDRNMYLYSIPQNLKIIFQLVVTSALAAILVYLIKEKNKQRAQKAIFWILSLLVLIVIIKGGNEPLSWLTLSLYENFPLMRLYRSPQHLMFIPAFIIPILIAFSLNYFYKNLRYKKIVLIVSAFMVVIWISGWWYNGDLGHQTLLKQNRDHVDFYTLSPELKKVYQRNEKSLTDHRILFLPAVYSPQYLKTKYQNRAQGGQPEYMYLRNPTFVSESNPFANKIETLFGKNIEFNYIDYLRLFSVRDIVLRYDIYPLFTESAKYWDSNKVKEILDSSDRLNKFLEGKYEIGYSIKPEYFLPHFYVPQNITYSNGGIEIIPEIINSKDYDLRSGIYLGEINELEELKKGADEIFVKGELAETIGKEALEGVTMEAVSPFIKYQPGEWVYWFVLKKEELDKWKVRKNPEKIFEKNLLYASKRITELVTFDIRDTGQLNSLLENYKQEMESAIGKTKEVDKLKAYLKAHRRKIDQSNLEEDMKDKMRKAFDDLEDKIVELEPKRDFSRMVSKFEIPKSGNYSLFIKDINGLTDYSLLGERNFGEEEQELILPFSGISENLIDENLRIKDYSPNSIYRISFNYKAPKGGSFFVAEGERGETAETQLFSTGDEFRNFEMFFKSSPNVQEAAVHLSISVSEEKNLKVERIYQPEVILKNIKYQISNIKYQTPKITFVKINPTKYRVKVEGVSQPYTLVFSESFHRGWKAYISDQQSAISNQYGEIVASYFDGEIKEGTHKNIFLDRNTFETWGKKAMSEENHLLVNGYANSWYITPEDAGGRQDYELIIEFAPQKLFYIGLFISGITLVGCLIYFLYVSIIRRNRQ